MKSAKTVNIHEAKTHLSRLIEEAVQGEPFVIAKAGKPVVRVTAIDAPPPLAVRRTGFLAGQSLFPTISTTWERMKLPRSSMAGNETAPRYAPAPLDSE